jgi:hypothetical protein
MKSVPYCFPDGGLVIGAGCALPAETPSKNIHAFVQKQVIQKKSEPRR